jgi:hypothetical protein
MRAMIHCVIAVLLVSGPSNPAAAEFFGISLPELIGPGPVYPGGPIEIDFDFGQEFEQVDNVVLMIEATVTPLVVPLCGISNDPDPCERRVVNLGFLALLEGPELNSTHAVVDDFRGYPLKRAGVFQRGFGDFSFRHLTGGSGTVKVWWNMIAFLDPLIVEIVRESGETTGLLAPAGNGILGPGIEPPTATITDAVLIIEATPAAVEVPEQRQAPRGWRRWSRRRH